MCKLLILHRKARGAHHMPIRCYSRNEQVVCASVTTLMGPEREKVQFLFVLLLSIVLCDKFQCQHLPSMLLRTCELNCHFQDALFIGCAKTRHCSLWTSENCVGCSVCTPVQHTINLVQLQNYCQFCYRDICHELCECCLC